MSASPSPETARDPSSNLMFPALVTGVFAILLRLPLISRSELSGDESVFGLMAFAIARGEDYPLYCWGAHYASALISYISIPAMAALGPSPFSFKIPTLLYDAFLAPLVFLSLRRSFDVFNSYLASLAVAAPLSIMLLYSTLAHGGYPETYFLGFAIWVVTIGASRSRQSWDLGFAGFLMGASFAILWLGVPFIISALALLAWKKVGGGRSWAALAAGFFLGSMPFWIYNALVAPGATIRRLGARSLEATAESSLWDAALGRVSHLPRWCVESLEGLSALFAPLGGAPGAIIVIGLTLWGGIRLCRAGSEWGIIVISFLGGLLLFNLAGNLTRDRQWTTLLLAVVVAFQSFGRIRARLLLIAIVVVSLYSDIRYISNTKTDPDVRTVAGLLMRTGADGLYADYDLGYSVAFRMGGSLPVSATMPPNASDRRPDWTDRMRYARRPAVLLPDDGDARMWERALVKRHIDFSSFMVGQRGLYVFYEPLPPDLVPLAPKSPSR